MGNLFDTSEDVTPATHEDFEFEKKEEAGNVTEGAETKTDETETKAEEQAPDKGNAELILGKYKTTEELAKAHEALQKRLGELRNELGNLRKQQPQQVQETKHETKTEDGGWTDSQWQNFNNYMNEQYQQQGWKAVWELAVDAARQAVTPLQEVVNSQQLSSEQSKAVNSELSLLNMVDDDGNPLFPDAEAMMDDIEEFLGKHTYFNDLLFNQYKERKAGKLGEYDMGVLEVLYKAVKAEKVENLGKQAYNNGLQQGIQQARAKTGAQIQKPGTKQTNTEPTPEEQIVNEIFAHKKGGFFI